MRISTHSDGIRMSCGGFTSVVVQWVSARARCGEPMTVGMPGKSSTLAYSQSIQRRQNDLGGGAFVAVQWVSARAPFGESITFGMASSVIHACSYSG